MVLNGFLRITKASGDMLNGDSRIEHYENWIPIWGRAHRVKLPTTPDGLPTGKRIHLPFKCNKLVDRTSPFLYQFLSTGEILKEVMIDWHRVNPKTQHGEAYFRQTFRDVQISGIDFEMQHGIVSSNSSQSLANTGHIETVEFIYDNVIWTYLDGGVEYEDQVSDKPAPQPASNTKELKPVKEKHQVSWQPKAKDQLPMPDDYLANLLVYTSDHSRKLNQKKHHMANDELSRVFSLPKNDAFEAFVIEPHMKEVMADLKANRNIKQSINDGLIAPLKLQGSDITPKGDTLHYAPIELPIERQIQIKIKDTPESELNFEIKGGTNAQQTFNADEKPKEPLKFEQLDGSQNFSLHSTVAGLPAIEIIPDIPLKDWLDIQKLKSHGIGSNGGPQLLDYKLVKGHIPQLTFMPQPPQFGLFFDGTRNNKTNDNVDVNDDKEPTNIAKLSELYVNNKYSRWYYEEGIGTEAHKADSMSDLAFAYSLDEHINNALKEIREFFEDFKLCNIGFIDIFGFSRGATQARMMVNIIHYLNENEPDYWGGPKLVVRFVGIYDTVGSVGVGGDNDNQWIFGTGKLPGEPETATLDIAEKAVCAVHHLAALDEERENFPLSSLKTSKNSQLPKYFSEDSVPGAHADVGGGYGTGESIIRYPEQIVMASKNTSIVSKEKQRIKQTFEKEYYRPGINIQFDVTEHHGGNHSIPKTILKPYWKRQVSNQLSLIYLEAMHKKALEFGVPFDPLPELEKFKHSSNNELLYKYDTPAKLEQLCQQAMSQGVNSQAYKDLSEHYIHHSHRHTGVMDTIAYAPESDPEHAFGNYGREVFYAENTGLGDQGEWQLHTDSKGGKQWHKS